MEAPLGGPCFHPEKKKNLHGISSDGKESTETGFLRVRTAGILRWVGCGEQGSRRRSTAQTDVFNRNGAHVGRNYLQVKKKM